MTQAGDSPFSAAAEGEDLFEPHWLNWPNGLTLLRVALVPVILALLVVEGSAARWWAFGVFVFAAVTDSVDGWVARRFNGVTRWGQLADPIADKALIVGALTALALVGDLPWWVVAVVVAREAAVTMLRLRLVRSRQLVLPASRWGKIKTVAQVVAISAVLAPAAGEQLGLALLYVAVVLTVWSGVSYAFLVGRASDAPAEVGTDDDVVQTGP